MGYPRLFFRWLTDHVAKEISYLRIYHLNGYNSCKLGNYATFSLYRLFFPPKHLFYMQTFWKGVNRGTKNNCELNASVTEEQRHFEVTKRYFFSQESEYLTGNTCVKSAFVVILSSNLILDHVRLRALDPLCFSSWWRQLWGWHLADQCI